MGRLRPGTLEAAGVKLPGDVLIETGTCSGNGVRSVKHLFKTIHTIELDPAMYNEARRRLRRAGIVAHLGSSPEVLKQIIDPSRETVFWLDAHYVKGFGADSVSVSNQCPLLDELRSIFSFRWKVPPHILIDDAEYFGTRFWRLARSRGYNRADWPTFKQIGRRAHRAGLVMSKVRNTVILSKGIRHGLEGTAG